MARTIQLTIEPGARGRWVVGPEAAASGPRVFDSKAAALAHARATARRAGAVLVVKGNGGRIERLATG